MKFQSAVILALLITILLAQVNARVSSSLSESEFQGVSAGKDCLTVIVDGFKGIYNLGKAIITLDLALLGDVVLGSIIWMTDLISCPDATIFFSQDQISTANKVKNLLQ
mmetsp:Transcript_3911/g.3275  ORF Transcript_3911/g.3275 Transcript_3911/m.3275 type:complete len:109 (+) Transcript_3911:39-365(+)